MYIYIFTHILGENCAWLESNFWLLHFLTSIIAPHTKIFVIYILI